MGFFSNVYIQRLWRGGRVVFLSYGIYQAGVQNGMATVLEDPIEIENRIMAQIMQQYGATKIMTNSEHTQRLNKIGKRVIAAASAHCTMEKHTAELTDSSDWDDALKRLRGDWKFVIIDAGSANAFVSSMLPRRVIVHQGFFNIMTPTDDELALILAHEISHVIHNHNSLNSIADAATKTLQLLAFAFFDPSGAFSFFVLDYILSFLSDIITASYSRENETEADTTGLIIAAIGCFNTKEAVQIFRKFHIMESDREAQLVHWHDSHPLSIDRLHHLHHMSETHNSEDNTKYKTICTEAKTEYISAWQNWKNNIKSHLMTHTSTNASTTAVAVAVVNEKSAHDLTSSATTESKTNNKK